MYHLWHRAADFDRIDPETGEILRVAKNPGRRLRVLQVVAQVSSATNPNYPVTGNPKSDNRIGAAFGYRSIANHYAAALVKRLPPYDDGKPAQVIVLECDDDNCTIGGCKDIRPGVEKARREKLTAKGRSNLKPRELAELKKLEAKNA